MMSMSIAKQLLAVTTGPTEIAQAWKQWIQPQTEA